MLDPDHRRGPLMMTLDSAVATAQISDRRAAAAAARAARAATSSPSVADASGERGVLRRAQRQDANALDRLAALDGVRRPAGELMLAEVDGEILAAVPVAGGRAIADPLRPTPPPRPPGPPPASSCCAPARSCSRAARRSAACGGCGRACACASRPEAAMPAPASRTAPAAVDTHGVASRMTSSRLIGRAAELAELEAALADAGGGRPSLAFVAGESGVGKSRTVGEVGRLAREAGGRVRIGGCGRA